MKQRTIITRSGNFQAGINFAAKQRRSAMLHGWFNPRIARRTGSRAKIFPLLLSALILAGCVDIAGMLGSTLGDTSEIDGSSYTNENTDENTPASDPAGSQPEGSTADGSNGDTQHGGDNDNTGEQEDNKNNAKEYVFEGDYYGTFLGMEFKCEKSSEPYTFIESVKDHDLWFYYVTATYTIEYSTKRITSIVTDNTDGHLVTPEGTIWEGSIVSADGRIIDRLVMDDGMILDREGYIHQGGNDNGGMNNLIGGVLTVTHGPVSSTVAIYPDTTISTLLDLFYIFAELEAKSKYPITASPFSLETPSYPPTPFDKTGKFMVMLTTSDSIAYIQTGVDFVNGSATVDFLTMQDVRDLPLEE